MNLDALRASDLMSTKVATAEPHESLRLAVRRMAEHRIHCLLVSPTTPGHGIGILTGKDCIQVVADAGPNGLDELCVEDAMTRPAISVPADLCIADCLRLMRMAGVRTAPVLDGPKRVGILSFTDVLDRIARDPDPGGPD